MLREMKKLKLLVMLMILFGIVGPATAEPVTVSYCGIIDRVDDRDEQLDGSVFVGGTFSGTYTFESTAVNQGTSTFAQYLYDEEAPIGMTMTATVGNYTFQTDNFDLVNFTSVIYVKNNDSISPRDAYTVKTREITQTAGPDLGLGVYPMAGIGIELITFDNLSTFTDVSLPLTMPDLANFELANRFTLDLGREVDARMRGYLTSLQTLLDPAELLLDLAQDVIALNLQQGIENSLDAKLDAALHALDAINENNYVAAINTLEAFINAVEAQRGGWIPEADADALICAAQVIIDILSGP